MKIITISDTHIKDGSVYQSLPEGLITQLKEADLIIHAGDFVSLQSYTELAGINELIAVCGNIDDENLKTKLPLKIRREIEGVKIGVVHEGMLSLQATIGARYLAKEMDVDVLVIGHLHRPVIEKSDVLIVCPGSPTSPKFSSPSAVELTFDKGKVSGRIITFSGASCKAIEVVNKISTVS